VQHALSPDLIRDHRPPRERLSRLQ
jgi:hypothetical protein